jgi:hypothetical protein
MKKLLVFLALLVITALSLSSCVDPDEAMPHYQAPVVVFDN